MVRRRNRRSEPVQARTRLPYAVDDALKLALSTAASIRGDAGGCARRACRETGRCQAAGEGEWCVRPLPDETADMALAMMVFATRLLLRRP